MDASQVLQGLDSLWLYTNIFTRSDDPLPSLAPPLITPKCDSNTPHNSPTLNLQDESDEIVGTVNVPCEPETEMKNSGGRKRRKRSERHGTRKQKNGVGLRFDKRVLSSGLFKLNPTSWTLPYHDEIAMKEHLKCWAYAVACIVK